MKKKKCILKPYSSLFWNFSFCEESIRVQFRECRVENESMFEHSNRNNNADCLCQSFLQKKNRKMDRKEYEIFNFGETNRTVL
jgi:hypothetical protein